MRNDVKNVALGNNSIQCATPDYRADQSSTQNRGASTRRTADRWQRLSEEALFRGSFSDEPETFLVRIIGTRWNDNGGGDEPFTLALLVDAYHPLMAQGHAVSIFMRYTRARVHNMHIQRRIDAGQIHRES